MQKVKLYKYEEANGMVTITPDRRNDTDLPSRMRLIADENMLLTNGIKELGVIDVALDEVIQWTEIEDTSENIGGEF